MNTPNSPSVPNVAPVEEQVPAYTEADAESLLGDFPLLSSSTQLQPLVLPVALPQTGTSYDSPFARAYHPYLELSGVQQDYWLKFIDSLNIAMTASPPLRVIDLAGKIIGFVPYHWAIIAGIAMQAAAQTAMHVLSKTLTDKLLLVANTNYFEPRGLKVRLMKTAALRHFIHIDDASEGSSGKFKKFAKTAGRKAQNVALHLPLRNINSAIIALSKRAPTVDPMSPDDVTGRRIANLQGYIHPISFDVPPPASPESLLDKTSALAVKLNKWRSKKSETKAMRKRRLLATVQGRAPRQNQPSTFTSALRSGSALNVSSVVDLYSNMRAQREEQAYMAGGLLGGVRAKQLEHEVDKLNLLEANHTDGLVWVVLLNIEQDVEIERRDLADNVEDESIGQSEWENEMNAENEVELIELQRLARRETEAGSSRT